MTLYDSTRSVIHCVRVQADGQQDFRPEEGSRASQTLQASGFHSEAILSCLRGSHWPRVRQFEHHNEIMTVINYNTLIRNTLKISAGGEKTNC